MPETREQREERLYQEQIAANRAKGLVIREGGGNGRAALPAILCANLACPNDATTGGYCHECGGARNCLALAQILRGEYPLPNTASMCVLALARLDGRHDWRQDKALYVEAAEAEGA